MADKWAENEELRFDRFTADDAAELIGELSAFARRARDGKGQLLLWMCL